MSIGAMLAQELEQELQTTRRLLERTPESEWEWRPHEKSMTLGALASHIVESMTWAEVLLKTDELDFDPDTYQSPEINGRAQLLALLDQASVQACALLKETEDAAMMTPWAMKKKGEVLFSMPRAAVVRSFLISHMIHHRGQLSVYFRMKDVPLPAIYGPTADEPM